MKICKLFFIIILTVFYSVCFANETDSTANDTTKADSPWLIKGVTSFNISQVALENWTQGGENSVSYNIIGDFRAKYTRKKYIIKNNLNIRYGSMKLGNDDFKTNDNELFLESSIRTNTKRLVNPSFSNSIRTVLVDGYDYEKDPRQKISKFFDPGYLIQSFGITYDKNETFKSRMGVAFKETFTQEFNSYSDDEDTEEIEKFKFESGIESVTEIAYTLPGNMYLESKISLFGRFEEITVWDVRCDSKLTAKINSHMNVNLSVLVVYDKTQSLKTQIKEALQLGITYNLF